MEAIQFNFGQSNVLYHHKYEKVGTGGGIVNDNMDNKPESSLGSSAGAGVVKRYTVPLKEIFERHNAPKVIDYLSLDVEGAESYIMSSFPFEEYKFRVASIERPKEDLQKNLKSNNYTLVQTLGRFGETIWVHASEMGRIRINNAGIIGESDTEEEESPSKNPPKSTTNKKKQRRAATTTTTAPANKKKKNKTAAATTTTTTTATTSKKKKKTKT